MAHRRYLLTPGKVTLYYWCVAQRCLLVACGRLNGIIEALQYGDGTRFRLQVRQPPSWMNAHERHKGRFVIALMYEQMVQGSH